MSTLINKNPERRVQYKIEANKTEIMFPNLECLSAALLRDLLPSGSSPAGDSAYITDASDLVPVESLKVNIQPVQTGTGDPSPENVRPISGWDSVKVTRAGKNVMPFSPINDEIANVTVVSNAEKQKYIVSGTSTEYKGFVSTNSFVIKAGTYVLSRKASNETVSLADARLELRSLDGLTTYMNSNNLNVVTFDTDTEVRARFIVGKSGVNFGTGIEYQFQLELGSTATTYEPYQGQDYTIPLGQTVYGGTLDVTTGELIVDKAMHTFDGSETFGGDGSANAVVPRWNYDVGGLSYTGYCSSNMLRKVDSYTSIRRTTGSMAVNSHRILLNPEGTVYASSSEATSFIRQYCVDMVSANTPLQVVYELATPQTYTLTPQEITLLLGDNTVFADAGPIEVTYGADIQRYIDKKIAETQALILEN